MWGLPVLEEIRIRGGKEIGEVVTGQPIFGDDLVENKKSKGVNPPSSDPQRNNEPKIPRDSRQLLRCHLDLQPWRHDRHTIRLEKCGWVEGANIYRWRVRTGNGVFRCWLWADYVSLGRLVEYSMALGGGVVQDGEDFGG